MTSPTHATRERPASPAERPPLAEVSTVLDAENVAWVDREARLARLDGVQYEIPEEIMAAAPR